MAEAIVSLLIEHLGSLVLERIGEEVRLVKGVKEDVANLKSNLEDIEVLLEDAEEKQLKDAGVRRWLDKLKKASHDVDDVLDEWGYAVLDHKLKKEEEGDHQNAIPQKKKVRFSTPSFFRWSTKVNQLSMSRDMALKIKESNEVLDRIAKEKDRYNLDPKRVVQQPEGRKTACLIDETEVHGRDNDKSTLVSKLLCENNFDNGRSGPEIIPIVGMGGLGKTTLAQFVYNNKEVEIHFDKRIWVCVSDPFEEIKIAKAILEGLGTTVPNSVELNPFVTCIHESIEGKRTLLVLDDVWLEDDGKWKSLHNALRNCAAGSKILVTTRKEEVAIMMGASQHKMVLEKLSEEDCWLIFGQLAFMERTAEERLQLEEIGRKIASKSSGLPLVAKTLGGLMRFRNDVSQWEDILNNELWESEDKKVKEIFAPFLLSYYDLSPLEKRCFLYCSIFPKDSDIKRNELIEMWMSQGYLGQDMNSKKRGQKCFESLMMRSFFQNCEESYFGNIICKMHDIVHDFAQFLTGNEYMLMEVGEKMEVIDESARHLTLVVGHKSVRFLPTLRYKNAKILRTLYISDSVFTNTALFSQLMGLRTLSLIGCEFKKLPDDIGKTIHLRYLDLSRNPSLTELPDALCNLYNLKTLRLCSCYRLERLPETIWKLVNLRNLYIYGSGLKGLPKGMGRLTCLQTLDTLVVPKEEDRETYLHVSELKMLSLLEFEGFLCIERCADLRIPDEIEIINLKSRKHLVKLRLSFRKCNDEVENNEDDEIEVLEALQPPPNLKSLTIFQYTGACPVFPGWMMSLVNLTDLCLSSFINCETLPPLGKMPSLESLSIGNMGRMEKIGPEFLGATETEQVNIVGPTSKSSTVSFPRLKTLKFYYNRNWKEWVGYCGETSTRSPSLTIMPRLQSLEIDECRSLETLPDFLQMIPLQTLTIMCCDSLKPRCLKETSGQEWFKIFHIPNIQFDKKHVQRDGVWIQQDN